jgi:hypothetical protein
VTSCGDDAGVPVRRWARSRRTTWSGRAARGTPYIAPKPTRLLSGSPIST